MSQNTRQTFTLLQTGVMVVLGLAWPFLALSLGWYPQVGEDFDHKWLLKKLGLPRFKWPHIDYTAPPVPDISTLYDTMEEISSQISTAEGQVPNWLKGSLLRNGPGLLEFGDDRVKSLGDGLPMIRKYHIEAEKMNMTRKLLQSETLLDNLYADKITKLGMKTSPQEWTMKDRLMSILLGHMGDIQNVHTIQLFGHYYATSEIPTVIEYDPKTLKIIQTVDLSKIIPGLLTMTPHPEYDDDGTMWNVGIKPVDIFFENYQYVVFKVNPPITDQQKTNPWQNLEVVVSIPSPRRGSIPYFHSFFMTEKYLVLPEHPWITCDTQRILSEFIFKGKGFMDHMYWDKDAMLEFKVIDKVQGVVLPARYIADPGVMFHPIKAYQDGQFLILDAPFAERIEESYDFIDASRITAEETQKRLSRSASAIPLRYALPLRVLGPKGITKKTPVIELTKHLNVSEARAWTVAPFRVYLHPEYLALPEEIITHHRQFEFGAVNPNYTGKRYRYTYGLGFPTSFLGGRILKLDVVKKVLVGSWEDSGCLATEPIFVPRPVTCHSNNKSGDKEMDGVLVFVCHETRKGAQQTSLIVLSSKLKEIGRFRVPVTTTVGIHGIWLPSEMETTFQEIVCYK